MAREKKQPQSLKRQLQEDVLSPHNLPYRIRLLVQLLTRRFADVLAPDHLTPLHWGILCCLWQQDGMATQAIAHQLQQLGGTITMGLDTMEKRDLVHRNPDPDDRRISRVWLTKQGEDLQGKLVPRVESFVQYTFSCLSAEDYEHLSTTVNRLREHLDSK